jgi:hypothetical protein
MKWTLTTPLILAQCRFASGQVPTEKCVGLQHSITSFKGQSKNLGNTLELSMTTQQSESPVTSTTRTTASKAKTLSDQLPVNHAN